MGKFFLFMLYIVFAFILGILSVVLKKKHTQFPDFRVGYHNKKIMENKEIGTMQIMLRGIYVPCLRLSVLLFL